MERIPRTIFFSGTVAASTGKALVSNIMTHPFDVMACHVNFVQGTDNTLKIELLSTVENSVSGTTRVTNPGYNVFSAGNLSSDVNPFMVGDQYISVHHFYTVPEGYYLKIFANNTDTSSHSIEVRVEGFEVIS